jgi:hypothetical protein
LCPACQLDTQDTTHLILTCPATHTKRISILGPTPSLTDLWCRPRGVARLLGLDISSPHP